MKHIKFIGILFFLTSCAGGTIGGLFPAPKILKGKLDNLTYTSPDGIFSVNAPVKEERGEWRYTEVRENHETGKDQNFWFVGFKTPYDSHYYTVEVLTFPYDQNQADLRLISSDVIKSTIKLTEERWKSKANVLTNNTIDCDTRSYTYTVLQQHVTTYDPNFDKYFLISQLAQNNSLVIVVSELNYDLRGKKPPIEDIKNMNIEKHNNFVCSVRVPSAEVKLKDQK